jgi:hypothetical protein
MAKKKRTKADWQPNSTSFWEGQPHVQSVLKKAGLDPDARVVTSRDPAAKRALELLETKNVPPGFKKWQLPFSLYGPSNAYLTVGTPKTHVPPHAHKEGAGYRLIVDGSIHVKDKELTAGDWMYVPKGEPYGYTVGLRGVTLFASYQC